MIYTILFIILVVTTLFYFKLADRYNIIDKPNERSSHTILTIRGGGVIFPISILLWFFAFNFQYPWFCLALVLISTISFLDDIYTLPTKPRILIHLISVLLVLYQVGLPLWPWFCWPLVIILIIGWINAFNFMDGINGITVFYALVAALSLVYLNHTITFTNSNLIYLLLMSLLIFGFFNVRKKAKTFAGDVGSVSLALILSFLMLQLILETGRIEYLLFYSVYGLDSIITIIQRLMRKENIFKAHRSHLYQYLANEKGMSHVSVSIIYAFVQLLINLVVIYSVEHYDLSTSIFFISVLAVLGLIYIFIKRKVVNQITL